MSNIYPICIQFCGSLDILNFSVKVEPASQVLRLISQQAWTTCSGTGKGQKMIETSMRGTRLGAISLERDDAVPAAERMNITYVCPQNHKTVVPMSVEAEEIPYEWDCRCGAIAYRPDEVAPEKPEERYVRTHWDMLLERRSMKELQEIYNERVALLNENRGSTLQKSA